MRYSEEIIEEVRTRNDIVGVISQVVNLKKKGGRYFGVCPFHNEKTPSFSVSQDNQMYYCFGCGAGGNVMTFVMQYENYSFTEAMEFLAERAGIELPHEEISEEQKKEADIRTRMLNLYKDAATFYYRMLRQPVGENAMAYFRKRGLSDETMKKFGLGYAPQSGSPMYRYLKQKGYDDQLMAESRLLRIDERGARDSFWNRAMFPIMDVHNRVIGFGGRVMGEGEPKYPNSPETRIFDKSRNLYGLNIARSSRRPYLLLCEGYMDVISLHQAGFDCAVASLGTALTSGHASLIKRYTTDVIITYDSDGAGQKAASRAIPILKQAGLTVKVLNMKPYKDPDEFINNLGAEEYQKRIDEAVNSFLFECDVLYSTADLSDPQKKTEFHRALASKLAGFTDTLERENYLESVAARYGIQKTALRELVNYIGGSKPVNEEQEDELKSLPRREAMKNEHSKALREAERLVLNWLANTGMSFGRILDLVQPDYFTDELHRSVADVIFEALAEGRKVSPASIMTIYAETDEQRNRVAAIFNTELPEGADFNAVMTENIKLLKRENINNRLRSATAPAEIQNIIIEKAELDRTGIWQFQED